MLQEEKIAWKSIVINTDEYLSYKPDILPEPATSFRAVPWTKNSVIKRFYEVAGDFLRNIFSGKSVIFQGTLNRFQLQEGRITSFRLLNTKSKILRLCKTLWGLTWERAKFRVSCTSTKKPKTTRSLLGSRRARMYKSFLHLMLGGLSSSDWSLQVRG